MSKHGANKGCVCPICHREFDRPFDLKQHQARKGHKSYRVVTDEWFVEKESAYGN